MVSLFLWLFFLFGTSVVGVGPRLSSFLVNISEEGILDLGEARQILPLPSTHTLQLCAYVLHESPEILPQFSGNAVLAEYGFQV